MKRIVGLFYQNTIFNHVNSGLIDWTKYDTGSSYHLVKDLNGHYEKVDRATHEQRDKAKKLYRAGVTLVITNNLGSFNVSTTAKENKGQDNFEDAEKVEDGDTKAENRDLTEVGKEVYELELFLSAEALRMNY